MINIIEFYRFGNEHVPVNSALIFMISRQFSGETVQFLADEEHVNNIKNYLADKHIDVRNVSWQSYTLRHKNGKGIRLVLRRMFFESYSLFRLRFRRDSVRPSHIFFLSLSPITAFFFKGFVPSSINTIITLHGDVEFITLNNNLSRNFLGLCFRLSFFIKRINCRYLVLDEVIRKNLVKLGVLKKAEITAIPHPYIFKEGIWFNAYQNPYVFAHIGIASMEKQSFNLFLLAQRFKYFIENNRADFRLIGRNENIENVYLNGLVKNGTNTEMLDRVGFEKAISQIHYALFFYNDIYKFTGSGAVLDAISYNKPVIALSNELFKSIFEKAGKIGFLCNTVSEMELIIESILSGEVTINEYKEMQHNMELFKKKNSLDKIRQQLFEQFTG